MGIKERFTTLLGDGEPDSRGADRRDREGGFFAFVKSEDIERRSPPKDAIQKYWRIYETEPIVRSSINTYASDVMEPGVRVNTDDEDLKERLEEWMRHAAILEGESNADFERFLEQFLVQREVRGTALAEVVPQANNPENMWGFRLLNPETMDFVTKRRQNILIQPEDTDLEGVEITPNGEAAAYVQYSDGAIAGPFADRDEIPFSQNDIVKMTLDADTHDVFGTSRLEAIEFYIEGLRQIVSDNEEAIAAKGYPHWIFKLGEPNGSEENPRDGVWPEEKVKELRNEHAQGKYSAGQKDFLPGDVDVDVVHGEVADIDNVLDFYTEKISAALPVPKYRIGYADDINRDITQQQDERYQNEIRHARNELENIWSPVIERKAEEWGFDEKVCIEIAPQKTDYLLGRDNFDAQAAQAASQAISMYAGDRQPSDVVPIAEFRERVLGLPAESDFSNDAPLPEEDEEEASAYLSEALQDVSHTVHTPSYDDTTEDRQWDSIPLQDFTDESWDDLSDSEREDIGEHFIYSLTGFPAENYGDMGFEVVHPDGTLNLRALRAVKSRASQADVPAEVQEEIENVADELAEEAFGLDWTDD